ncbi:MAG TPA: putative Ig domain-containing protein [Deltaproteobacteria bacterium]|nr:putative Ig domain-containing protein [Deltaproteobacteria bacterium]
MEHPSARTHRETRPRPGTTLGRALACALCALIVAAFSCSPSERHSGTGDVAFSISPPATGVTRAAQFDCTGAGIQTVRATVNAGTRAVASGGPWPCTTGEGVIGGVEAGSGYTVTVELLDVDGRVQYRGTSRSFDVVPGRVNDAGTITPLPVNSPPVFEQIAPISAAYGTLVTFTVHASDPDGDLVALSALSLPSGAEFDTQTGVFTWLPSQYQSGTHTVRIQAVDDAVEPLSAELSVTIVVGGAPVFNQVGTQSVAEGRTLSFTVDAVDPEGTRVTYAAVSIPQGASFDSDKAVFTWTPGYTQSGNYTARFSATDEEGLSSTLDVAISVTNTNRPPVISVPSSPVHFYATGVSNRLTISATDPDGDSLTFDAAEMPTDWWGSYIDGPVFTPSTRTFVWGEPGTANAGEYKVLFRVTDSGNPKLGDTAYVTIQVYDTASQLQDNTYPVLSPIGSQRGAIGQQLQFTVSATDADGDSLTYTAASIPGKNAPSGYTFADRVFSWTPSANGNYWLRFTVSDPDDHAGYTTSDSEDVVITVGNVNRPPVLDPIGRRAVYNNLTFSFVVTATDPDGDRVTYTATNLPRGASFDASTQTFTWDVVDFPVGSSYTVRFTATDSGSPQESDYEDVVFTVVYPPLI